MDNHKKKLFRLPNGMKVLIIPLQTNLTNVSISILLGSKHEKKHEGDITHYMEHLMGRFTSTKYNDYDVISRELSKRGADTNAYVSDYETKFYITGFYKDLPFFLDLLANTINNFQMIKSIAKNEKNAVIEELQKYMSDNQYPFEFKIWSYLNPKYSYQNDIVKQIEIMKKYDIENIYIFIKEHILLQNITISVSCPINAVTKTITLIKNIFNYPNKNKNKRLKYPTYQYKNNIFKIIYVNNKKKNAQSSIVLRVGKKIQYLSKEHICLIYLKNILFDFNTGVFYNILRKETGLIYSIHLKLDIDIRNSRSSSYYIETATTNANIPTLTRKMIDIIKALKITPEEYSSGKAMLLRNMELKKFHNLTSYNSYYEQFLMHDLPIIERSEIQKRYKAIKYDDVVKCLTKFKKDILKSGIFFYYSNKDMNQKIKEEVMFKAKYLHI